MLQTKSDLEHWYEDDDPWSYESTPDDAIRKDKILSALEKYGKFSYALDVGAGEGFITRDLPAERLFAYEISDKAAERLPLEVKRVFYNNKATYDLIVATGVFYKQYDWEEMQQYVLDRATRIILTSHIKDWEIPLPLKPIYEEEFPYREYTQVLRIYDVSTSQHRKRKSSKL